MSTPKLKRVIRCDSIPLDKTYYTDEGYLVDHPIVTSCGIFEYVNSDGSVRRELRLPENVFDPESLKSYRGKPIIITHDAGAVDKNNVDKESIGTILSDGYQDGNDVRAEIVIHNTDAMKSSGLRELSLGYELDLDETPGVYEGEPYDAVQKNIRVNHLALVDKARAGDQARLNIDGRSTMTGGKISMAKTAQSNPDLADAIARYRDRRAKRMDAEEKKAGPKTPEEMVQFVKDRRDRRDADGDPADLNGAMGAIAQQDEELDMLLDVIDTLMAKKDLAADCDKTQTDGDDTEKAKETGCDGDDADCSGKDGDDTSGESGSEETKADADDTDPDADDTGKGGEGDPEADPDDTSKPKANADSIDAIVAERLGICRVGDKLHMDGLDRMSALEAKKAVIRKVRPNVRLDGKSKAYIDAAYDIAADEVMSRKSTDYQRQQMTGDPKKRNDADDTSADSARQRMIQRNQKTDKEEKK